METGALAEELTCAVCLLVYQDPVILPCQHSFCLKCIKNAWAHAACQGGVSCPQCRRQFNPRPCLEKNFTLCNIVEKYNQSQTAAECTPVMCEYCIDNPSAAVKTCLKCETSFCSFHLKPHLTKETYKDHTLIEPIADLTKRQCANHKKILEYYCEQDKECVCISCTVIGIHKSHTLLSLDQAEARIKKKLKKEVENLQRVQKNCSIEQQDFKKSETKIKTLTNELKGNLSKKFSEWRKQLEKDEKYTLQLIDEEEIRVLSQIRSCSESLAKKMVQITSINDEAHKQLQRDSLSFIQDSKQLLSKISQFSRFRDTVTPHVNNPFMADNWNDAWDMNVPPQSLTDPNYIFLQYGAPNNLTHFSFGNDSYFTSNQTGTWAKNCYPNFQQATSFGISNSCTDANVNQLVKKMIMEYCEITGCYKAI
ncbi:E3 ubiquitin/ISG15 ligase TRIM25-like isoform X2 [Heterodontus francisci]|uniref:E3 ubiquitin/ISG15 ligase TRIM25-like isoform X2 n=1 Tax=Heterodontus francisci TaxID=7792 RepID=UPI00355B7699